MGGYERNSKPWTADHTHFDDIPADFNGRLLSEEWDRFEEIAINSQKRVPVMEQVGVKNFINGPEGFTPDNEFCLGETEVGGFFVAAGFCAHGIAGAGGIGKVVAEWVITGEPQMDLWHMDIRRFGAAYKSPSFTLKRTQENYESYYDLHYPGEERKSARPLKTSPAYPWHLACGAVFGEKSGWERVNYYKDHETNDDLKPYGWAGHHWSSAVAVEHHATRTHAGLFDESSFAKISVSGERAGDFLNHVCANDVVRGVGRATYTQALTTRGGIECDFTVTQTSENAFFIVTGTAFGTHDLGWLKKQRRELGFGEVVLEDVTGAYACFGLWGPNARKILEKLTPQDVSNEGFPFMTSREISIGDIPARATRITYVGELGWEFYVSTEFGAALWKLLFEAGEALGLMACGYKAIESLRLEKGYRAWGGEINTETNPWEAGLGFAVSKSKAEFIGREQLLAHKEKISRFLVAITFDDIRCVPLGNEPIRVNNQIIGRMKSGGQGYTIEKAIGYAYLPIEQATNGNKVEVEFFGAWEKGNVAVTPLFDAMNERIKS
jgi:4-methylaminobutanoate oxidase (formaldehyde-forming)